MKTFNQLDEPQRALAIEAAINRLLTMICEDRVKFAENKVNKKIEAAAKQADRVKTPWFMHEFVMDTCKDELHAAATVDAQRAYYREPGDLVLNLPTAKN